MTKGNGGSSPRVADEITATMVRNGWTDLWYANPFREGAESPVQERFGPRWHAGEWTGPDRDLLCVAGAATSEEAERFLSPAGWTPTEAVHLADKKRKGLAR